MIEKKKAILLIVLSVVMIVVSAYFIFFRGKATKIETEAGANFPQSEIVTQELDTTDLPYEDVRFTKEVETDLMTAYVIDTEGYNYASGYLGLLSDDEWLSVQDIGTSPTSGIQGAVQEISKSKIDDFEAVFTQKGYVKMVAGGYIAAKVLSNETWYYCLSYYIDDITAGTYVTTNKDKLDDGYALLTDMVMYNFPDPSVLEGTNLEEGGETDDTEIFNEIKYAPDTQKIKYKYDIKDGIAVFCAEHIDAIDKLYIRDEKFDIYYPDENLLKDYNEISIPVGDRKKGEILTFYIYSNGKQGDTNAYILSREDYFKYHEEDGTFRVPDNDIDSVEQVESAETSEMISSDAVSQNKEDSKE